MTEWMLEKSPRDEVIIMAAACGFTQGQLAFVFDLPPGRIARIAPAAPTRPRIAVLDTRPASPVVPMSPNPSPPPASLRATATRGPSSGPRSGRDECPGQGGHARSVKDPSEAEIRVAAAAIKAEGLERLRRSNYCPSPSHSLGSKKGQRREW